MAPLLSPTEHLIIVLMVLAISGILSMLLRWRIEWGRTVRFLLGGFLAVNELIWYGYLFHEQGFLFPDALPLQLCDLTLWLTVIAALTLQPTVYEVAYFGGIGGSSMALLTPDLGAPFPSYQTVYFFLSHGFVVITLVALTGGRIMRPRPGSLWRTFGLLNIYTAAVAVFDFIFKTNYMYLCQKPVSASLLDFFGPWPIYVLSEEAFAVLVFWLLWLPFRHRAAQGTLRRA